MSRPFRSSYTDCVHIFSTSSCKPVIEVPITGLAQLILRWCLKVIGWCWTLGAKVTKSVLPYYCHAIVYQASWINLVLTVLFSWWCLTRNPNTASYIEAIFPFQKCPLKWNSANIELGLKTGYKAKTHRMQRLQVQCWDFANKPEWHQNCWSHNKALNRNDSCDLTKSEN